MPSEMYPCYVRIGESPEDQELIELPTEADGRILLTTITAQYPDAIGLRFKSESGVWRGVRVTDGALEPPLEGWGYNDYFITVPKKAEKRKLGNNDGPANKTKKDMLSDLIVLGLPYSATEEDLKEYFEKFGDLAHYEVKYEMRNEVKRSRGFGFIRFTQEEVVEEVLDGSHSMGGRKLQVRFPNKPQQNNFHDNIATKLFIGRLPDGTTVDDLKDCFSEYGPLNDVYVPQNFRNFGFVTFGSQAAAQQVLSSTHQIKGNFLNISHPAPKAGEQSMQQQMTMQQYGIGMQGRMSAPMQGNMQGNIPGNMQGNMQSGMQGNMQGNMQSGMQGGMQGGNMQIPPQGGGYSGNQPSNKSGYYTSGYQQYGGTTR